MMFNCDQATRVSKALCFSGLLLGAAAVAQADPLSSNNGMYPDPADYSGRFNIANLDYPDEQPVAEWQWNEPLSISNAEEYMIALKKHIAPSIRILVEDPQNWDPVERGWYNMMWRGAGTPGNPASGHEPIMNTNLGQIVPSTSWKEPYRPTPEFVQNFGVIYYNAPAAYMLGQVWERLYEPDLDLMNFPEGSIVVKVEAAAVQPEDWPSVLNGASEWQVFRPTTEDQIAHKDDPSKMTNVVQTVYPLQLAIKVKDSVASPQTGWVFLGYVYDARSNANAVWDRFTGAGLMWGNDPDLALTRSTISTKDQLKETWVNPKAPVFVQDTLGWGGRFAAPMDVAVRHNVVFTSGMRPEEGFRVSSCLSCHGAAQFPRAANIYPSPNIVFPRDGDLFPLHDPGSKQWAEWFQNRRGNEAQSAYGDINPLDYDLTTMMALGEFARETGNVAHGFEAIDGH